MDVADADAEPGQGIADREEVAQVPVAAGGERGDGPPGHRRDASARRGDDGQAHRQRQHRRDERELAADREAGGQAGVDGGRTARVPTRMHDERDAREQPDDAEEIVLGGRGF